MRAFVPAFYLEHKQAYLPSPAGSFNSAFIFKK